jgi:hypothetical protein
MNLYRYCKNNPLAFVDPSGLVSICFYDPGAGSAIEESSNDWGEYMYPMYSIQDVIDKLASWDPNIPIDSIYFQDAIGAGEFTFGNTILSNKNPSAAQGLWDAIQKYTPDNCVIHLRNLAVEYLDGDTVDGTPIHSQTTNIEWIAQQCNRRVTGVRATSSTVGDIIEDSGNPVGYENINELVGTPETIGYWGSADYRIDGELVEASPNGGLKVIWYEGMTGINGETLMQPY